MNYNDMYLDYKIKYLDLKTQTGGIKRWICNSSTNIASKMCKESDKGLYKDLDECLNRCIDIRRKKQSISAAISIRYDMPSLSSINLYEISFRETYDNKFDYDDAINSITERVIDEDPNDVELIYREKFNDNVLRCKICGSTSGGSMKISHYYNCKYSPVKTGIKDTIRYMSNEIVKLWSVPKNNQIFPVMQRQLAEAVDKYPIIGTFGAGPCIIVAMRDPITKRTALAHIDALTTMPLMQFFNIFESSNKVHVYLCGGDSSNKKQCKELLEMLKNNKGIDDKYQIIFCHLIDHNSNSFGINSITGELYINNIKNEHFITDVMSHSMMIKNPQNYTMSLMFQSGLRNVTYVD